MHCVLQSEIGSFWLQTFSRGFKHSVEPGGLPGPGASLGLVANTPDTSYSWPAHCGCSDLHKRPAQPEDKPKHYLRRRTRRHTLQARCERCLRHTSRSRSSGRTGRICSGKPVPRPWSRLGLSELLVSTSGSASQRTTFNGFSAVAAVSIDRTVITQRRKPGAFTELSQPRLHSASPRACIILHAAPFSPGSFFFGCSLHIGL